MHRLQKVLSHLLQWELQGQIPNIVMFLGCKSRKTFQIWLWWPKVILDFCSKISNKITVGMVDSYLMLNYIITEYFLNTITPIYGRHECRKVKTKSVSTKAVLYALKDIGRSARKHAVVISVVLSYFWCAPGYVPWFFASAGKLTGYTYPHHSDGVRASSGMVLTPQSRNIPSPAPGELICPYVNVNYETIITFCFD